MDEVPLLKSTSGMKRRAPPGEASRATYSKAEGSKAFAQIVACRAGVATVDKLLRGGDFSGATTLLAQPPFSSFKQSALVLVNSKVLSMEDIKAIGTEKRFGVGADVIIMLGGLADATERSDRGAGLDYASKAAASLDEIIAIGRSNGL